MALFIARISYDNITTAERDALTAAEAPKGTNIFNVTTGTYQSNYGTGAAPVWEDFILNTEKGVANGVATLDGTGKIPTGQMPISFMDFKGNWNATTNTPTLANTDVGADGDVYVVSVAGTTDFGAGPITFAVGDWVFNTGTIWDKGDNTDNVTSVNTQTGVVVLDADDISDAATANKFVTAGDITNLGNLSGTNSGDVTLLGTPDYITITGQAITRNAIDLAADVTGTLPVANGGTGSATQNFWDLTTDQTSAGTKTMSALIPLSFTNAGAQIASAGNINFMRLAAGKSKITLTANGAFNAEFSMIYGSDVNANLLLSQLATSTQLNFGSSVSFFYINTSKADVNTVIRGTTNNNLFIADAGLDAIGIGAGPNASSILQLTSTTKAFTPPIMTSAQASAITAANGNLLYVTDTDATFTSVGFWGYEAGAWVKL